jgi:hypothetical protein
LAAKTTPLHHPQRAEKTWKPRKHGLPKLKIYLGTAPKGKTAPKHSIPLELFLTIASPNWRNTVKPAVGHPEKLSNPITRKMLFELLTCIAQTQLAPYHFHVSQGFELDKANGLQGVDAIRIIHLFCPHFQGIL